MEEILFGTDDGSKKTVGCTTIKNKKREKRREQVGGHLETGYRLG